MTLKLAVSRSRPSVPYGANLLFSVYLLVCQVEHVLPFLRKGIGIHHSGLLPLLKETIEILFAEGLIKVCRSLICIVTHAGCIAAGVGRAFSRICLSVCLFVCTVTGKRLELSTLNLIQIYSIVVARHALTQRSKV